MLFPSKLIPEPTIYCFTHENYKYPLMFAIDEEGGMMDSLSVGKTDPISLCHGVGCNGNTELVYL